MPNRRKARGGSEPPPTPPGALDVDSPVQPPVQQLHGDGKQENLAQLLELERLRIESRKMELQIIASGAAVPARTPKQEPPPPRARSRSPVRPPEQKAALEFRSYGGDAADRRNWENHVEARLGRRGWAHLLYSELSQADLETVRVGDEEKQQHDFFLAALQDGLKDEARDIFDEERRRYTHLRSARGTLVYRAVIRELRRRHQGPLQSQIRDYMSQITTAGDSTGVVLHLASVKQAQSDLLALGSDLTRSAFSCWWSVQLGACNRVVSSSVVHWTAAGFRGSVPQGTGVRSGTASTGTSGTSQAGGCALGCGYCHVGSHLAWSISLAVACSSRGSSGWSWVLWVLALRGSDTTGGALQLHLP
jgi:hypothetical protein